MQAKAEDRETRAQAAELEKARAEAVRVAEALEAQGKNSKGAEAALSSARDALQGQLQQLETQAADLEIQRQEAVARIAELEEQRRNEQAALAAATKHGQPSSSSSSRPRVTKRSGPWASATG